jgi:hypothetical protein
MRDLHNAVIEGAVDRVRPKIMTVCAILFGLLPIMWSPTLQAGADVMKRIAAPMIGGIVTSGILELLIYPVIYVMWRKRELPDQTEEEAPLIPPALVVSHQHRRRVLRWTALIITVLALFSAGRFAWHKVSLTKAATATPFQSQVVDGLTANFIAPHGHLHSGRNDILIEFRDGNGQLVDVGSVKLDIEMPSMQMHSDASVEPSNTGGRYRAKINILMPADWTTKLSFDGPHGTGQTNFSLNVSQ